MQWTHEQSPIIQSKASKILVRAFAGTGKTTTLVGFAKANPTLRILYLCYNSSVEKAAKGKFPRNVVCKTAHSLAHAVYGIQYAHKKTKNLRLTDIARGLDTQDWELVRDVLATLNNYMASADAELGRPHFPRFRDTALLQTIHAAGNTKTFSAEFNGAQLTSNNIQQALDAAGTRTSISVNTAQAVNISTLLALINSAKDTKKFSADFNGAQLTADNLQQAISAAAAGTSISVNTAQAANISILLQVINIAGNTKKFSANFNGAQLTSNNIQQALRAAGSNTSISMNSAQSANQSTLLELLDIASSSKQFQANYNGGMSNPSNLQQIVSRAGASATVFISDAQGLPIANILTLISSAG